MSKLTVLKNERDMKIDKRNQFLKSKWGIEEEISQINKDNLSFRRKNENVILDHICSTEKLQSDILHLNNQIRKINEEINDLNDQIKVEEILEFNSKFINDKKLSRVECTILLGKSEELSKEYESTIKEYSKVIVTLDSFLKGVDDDSFNYYWNQIKIKLKTKREELLNCKEKCFQFEYLEELNGIVFAANKKLEKMKSDFNFSKTIYQNFNSLINNFYEFLNIDSKLENVDENYLYFDLNQFQNDLKNKITDLINYKMQCLESNRLDDLNEKINISQSDFAKIQTDFGRSLNKSKMLYNKFNDFIDYYAKLLSNLNSKLGEVEDKYWDGDFEIIKSEIETKVDGLLHFQKLCFELNRLDDFDEAIDNTKNDLEKIKGDYIQSINWSKRLYGKYVSTIEDYTSFLSQLDSNLKETDDEFLHDICSQFILGTKAKLNDLLNDHELYTEYKRLDDLNDAIDVANIDLVKIKDIFSKNISKELYELIAEANSLIDVKSSAYSELDLKLSYLIGNAEKLTLDAKKELSDNLEDIRTRLNNEFENLKHIENELPEISQNFTDIKLIKDKTDDVTNLIAQLNDLNFEYFESLIVKEEKNYEALSYLDNDVHLDSVENLLNEFDKCFNRPMFKRQLKRYDLSNDELKIVKKEIRWDIINQVIVEGTDLKEIIKRRCSEFKKNNVATDENEIDEILNNINVDGIDDEIVEACKNNVKQDFMEGNISINNVELKFNNYVNKKITESNQLKELEMIKNSPDIPHIKVHLTPEENEEIYTIAKKEIQSRYGITGNVENYIYFLVNKKIRENKSEARGRLNIIKRDLSTLTQLNNKQQVVFINQIEFYIDNHQIKYYEVTEEHIIRLSKDFIGNGKINLR